MSKFLIILLLKSQNTDVSVPFLFCHSYDAKTMSQLSPVDLWHKLWQTRYLSPLSDRCFHIWHVKMSFSRLLLQISNRIIQSLPVAMKTKQETEGEKERGFL